MVSHVTKEMEGLRLNLSTISKNKSAVLGILLICISDSFAWLMPWPGLPLTGRSRRHAQSPVAAPLSYLLSHPSNSDRPAVTSLGHKLDHDQFSKVISDFKLPNGLSTECLFEVYSVTDGIQAPDGGHLLTHLYLVPGYFLLSLDDGLEIYRTLSTDLATDLYGAGAVRSDPEAWFPIMSSGKGDYILVNLRDMSVTEYQPGLQNEGFKFKDASVFFQYYSELFHNNEIELIDGVLSYRNYHQVQETSSELQDQQSQSFQQKPESSLLKNILRL